MTNKYAVGVGSAILGTSLLITGCGKTTVEQIPYEAALPLSSVDPTNAENLQGDYKGRVELGATVNGRMVPATVIGFSSPQEIEAFKFKARKSGEFWISRKGVRGDAMSGGGYVDPASATYADSSHGLFGWGGTERRIRKLIIMDPNAVYFADRGLYKLNGLVVPTDGLIGPEGITDGKSRSSEFDKANGGGLKSARDASQKTQFEEWRARNAEWEKAEKARAKQLQTGK
jgi:hypothetical protein